MCNSDMPGRGRIMRLPVLVCRAEALPGRAC